MILVTGAKGFLGKHLVHGLIAAGHTDTVGIDLADGDLTDPKVCEHLIHDYAPRTVVHFAAQVGRQFCEDDAAHAIKSNVTMTHNVASMCARYGASLVHTSTSEVYGEHGNETCTEDDPLTATPTGMYAMTKRWSEDVAREYGPADTKILRPSMPYGPGAPPGRGRRALDNFLWQAHHGMEMTVHKGAQRSWCFITDAIDAIRLVIEEGTAGAYNVGRNDCPVSMQHVAELACDMAGADYGLIRTIDPPARQTVVKKLADTKLRELGWAPKVELEEGMNEVYAWIKQFDKDGNYVGADDGRNRGDAGHSAIAGDARKRDDLLAQSSR